MNGVEVRAAYALAIVFAARLIGLFMIYPVFATFAEDLAGATPTMVGLALGAYGLTQALLQIPFGLLSDRLGRKPMIVAGLLIFGLGSVVAALATSIEGVLIGRVLQGAGAVGAVILALVADLTREENRTKAMAIIGITIGLSFAVAIAAGPALVGPIGVPGIFWLTAGLAVVGIAIVLLIVPDPERVRRHRDAETVPALLGRVLRNRDLLRLDFSIFALHAILTASFLAVPHLLSTSLSLTASREWMVYLPVLAGSVVLMVPALIVAEKHGRMKEIFLATIALLGASQAALMLGGDQTAVAIAALVAFFTGFNIMEASLPSLVTKTAPADAKGTATGVYSSAQFLGIFAGGALGGIAYGAAGTDGVFVATLGIAVLWFLVALALRRPRRVSSYLLRIGSAEGRNFADLAARLRALPGVVEASVVPEEGVAYLKIDRSRFDEASVADFAGV